MVVIYFPRHPIPAAMLPSPVHPINEMNRLQAPPDNRERYMHRPWYFYDLVDPEPSDGSYAMVNPGDVNYM